MFAAIHIPEFQLTAQLRHRPDLEGRPVAVLDDAALDARTAKDRGKARVTHRTAEAAECQVYPGMTATHAQARCEDIEILTRDLECEQEAQALLLECAEAFSPDFENTTEGSVTLDLLHLHADEESLGQQIIARLASHQLPVRVGVADNPDLSLLAAQLADSVRVLRGTQEEIRAHLAPLSLQVMPAPAELLEVLTSWGIHSFGDLTRLPRHEVMERLGAAAADLWDHASGSRRRLLKLVRPAADYAQRMDLEHEVTSLEPLLFLIRRFLETLSSRLASSYLVAERLDLTLGFANGDEYARSFRIPDPTGEVDLLFRILHTHLEDLPVRAPIQTLHLLAHPALGRKHQFRLFESSLRDPNRFSETLARLEALAGSEHVGTPELMPTHRADAFRMLPFADGQPSPVEHPERLPGAPFLGLPLRRFRSPQPVTVRTQREGPFERPQEILTGLARGPILRCRGPWLSSSQWWDRFAWSRQEWDVEVRGGGMFRLVRGEQGGWEVEGGYG